VSKFLLWLKGLGAAVLGGTLASVAQTASTGTLNSSSLKISAITGAALTLGAYFAQSPVTPPKN
jgi:hypothetical protein